MTENQGGFGPVASTKPTNSTETAENEIVHSAVLELLPFFDELSDLHYVVDYLSGHRYANRALRTVVTEDDGPVRRATRSADVPHWVASEDQEIWRQRLSDVPSTPEQQHGTFALTIRRRDGETVHTHVRPRWIWGPELVPVAVVLLLQLQHEGELPATSDRAADRLEAPGADRVSVVEQLRRTIAMAQSIADEFSARDATTAPSPAIPEHLSSLLPSLSSREREVLEHAVAGRRVATMALRMNLSENTIRNYMKRIYSKFRVSSEAELRELVGQRPSESAQ